MGNDTMRTLSLNGGGTIVEKQLSRNQAKMKYSYAITESPLPVENYKATIAVKKTATGSTIVWSSKFNAKGAPDAKAAEVISGIFDAGLASLQKKLNM
jgi:Polyketide cyclase / dehydrase and lipid transport